MVALHYTVFIIAFHCVLKIMDCWIIPSYDWNDCYNIKQKEKIVLLFMIQNSLPNYRTEEEKTLQYIKKKNLFTSHEHSIENNLDQT